MQGLLSERNKLGYFIIRLGVFHTRTSFLGRKAYVMSNSRMGGDLELTYAENILSQLFSGKTVGRTKKGHQMVDASLHTILLEEIIGSTNIDSDSTKQLFQEAIKGNLDVNSITFSEVLKMTQQKLNQ